MDLGFLKHLLTTTCLDQTGDLPPLLPLSRKWQKFERNTRKLINAGIDPAFDDSKKLVFEKMVVDDDHDVEEKDDDDVEEDEPDDDDDDDDHDHEQSHKKSQTVVRSFVRWSVGSLPLPLPFSRLASPSTTTTAAAAATPP